ncbi:hypothetical protein PFISCL1PPCAC_18743, partial [Pristionchus fissidentatus]
CTGLSFRDSGVQSSCSLLGSVMKNEVCSFPITIYPKQTTGCPARTNLTYELGVDPCVDEIFPDITEIDSSPICPMNSSMLIQLLFKNNFD